MIKQSNINVDEGKYAIHVHAFKKESDEPSAMASYLSKTAIVTNEADSLFLTVMLKDANIITGFQIENQAGEKIVAVNKHMNEETNNRFEIFELDYLTTPLPVRVQYEAAFDGQKIHGDEALRLIFDEKSLEKVE